MTDNRIGKERRVNPDRRKGASSSYNGPEKRGTKYRRSDKERREINNISFMKKTMSLDNESMRSGIEQREFSYTDVMPERRSGKDRRDFV